ncbi:MAG: PEP-CTERM sorting domain-containing protein [Rubrivivax sp.]|nr:PEP-CTERM sorting domain-containing protein [Rubrivivax sp.]
MGGALGVISWGEHVSYDNVVVTDYAANQVPEPGSLALVACALGLLGAAARRRKA